MKKIIINEKQYKLIKENEKKNPYTEWVLANSSLTFLIKDFMENGKVDPEYRELIQAELDNISSKKRSIR